MIKLILEFSVRQRMLVLIGTAVLVAFGVMSWQRIPIDAFPDVTTVQVQILANAGGMSPLEVEKLITRPIEIEMGGLPRLVEVRRILSDPPIGPAEIFAPRRAEDFPRRFRFLQPFLDGAVAAHLAGCQIAEADGEPERGMTRHDAAHTDFEVVGVRAEDEEINRHVA